MKRNRGASRRAAAIVTYSVALLVMLATVAPARAAETQWWTVSDAADHATSESRGVVVRPDGSMVLGPKATAYPVDSVVVLWSVAVRGDGTVVLGGEDGRLFTWTQTRGLRAWLQLPVGQVLSLLAEGDDVIAGTGPEGAVFKISGAGDTLRLASTNADYVWALAPARGDAWYAATGTEGKLMKVTTESARIVFDSDETNLVSMIADGKDGVFIGGDSKGRVFHVDGSGRARTLYAADEEEIRALAWDGQALYAAALSAKAVSNTSNGGSESPRPTRRAASRDRSVVYRIVPDSSAVGWWLPPHPTVFAAARTPRGIVFSTGNRAGLYALDGIGMATRLLAPEQGQITSMATGSDGALYAVTAHPAALWIVGPDEATQGELLSPVHDAERISRWGRLHWEGAAAGGRVTLATRSGNSESPDTTWSEWSRSDARGTSVQVTSPPARFIQWRVQLRGKSAVLTQVDLTMREHNVPPLIGNLRVSPPADGVRGGGMSPRSETVTQELAGGRKVEFSLKRQADMKDVRVLPAWMQGLRVIQWSAGDPNGDPMRYDLAISANGSDEWLQIAENLEDSTFVWDTRALPDGQYRLRARVTDAGGNAIGEERSAMTTSRTFTVDNTAPTVDALTAVVEAGQLRVRGRASDASSPLWRIELAVDEGNWRTVTPTDGILDDREHSFDVRVTSPAVGPHSVKVRVVDRAGNDVVRATRLTVR